MAEYRSDALGVKFELPDRVTVRQQLAFRSRVAVVQPDEAFVAYWLAALGLLSDWECERVPDPAALNMDEAVEPAVADIVQYTANTAAAHMLALRHPGKN